MRQKFSVAMSVYKNDIPAYFETSVLSIFNQTCPPDEIVLVIDGPIPIPLQTSVYAMMEKVGIMEIVRFSENKGHAAARQAGLEKARNELVAIMDSDDIAEPNRFEVLLKLLDEYPDVTVVGSIIHEFIGSPENVVGTRDVPEMDVDIKAYLKRRCPMNLVTVMLRKSDVMKVGGFIDWYCEEDYYLWIRLVESGYKFYNYQKSLVNVRVGEDMYQRRGGKKYFRSEARLQKYMFDHKMISLHQYAYNVMIRWLVQVAMPNRIRGWVFRTFARKQ